MLIYRLTELYHMISFYPVAYQIHLKMLVVESFLNDPFKRSIIASKPFSLALSTSSISSTASSASSSRDNTSAEPCLFAGKSVKRLHNLMRLSQSSCFTF